VCDHDIFLCMWGDTDTYFYRLITRILTVPEHLKKPGERMFSLDHGSEGDSAQPPSVKPRDDVTNWANATEQSTLSQKPKVELATFKETQTPSPEDCFILKSAAYLWLLYELQVRIQTHRAYSYTSGAMRLKVLRLLYSHESLRVMSSQTPTPVVHVKIVLFWQLEKYIESLQLPISPDMWEHVLCLTGSRDALQLTTVATYIRQAWPLSGEHLERMLLDSLRCRGRTHSCMHQDNRRDPSTNKVLDTFPSTLHVSIDDTSTDDCQIWATGGPHMVSEFVEQIAWLAAVLRHSPLQGKVAVLSPHITLSPPTLSDDQDGNATSVSVVARLEFDVQENQETSMPDEGTCWTLLFTNPILVSGYPILAKSTPATGLEISLSIMASILKAHQIVRLNNRIVMKGFNSLVVASAIDGAFVRWHVFTSGEQDKRISYFDPRIEESVSNREGSPLLRSLEGFRHIIGWCSEATEFCGKL